MIEVRQTQEFSTWLHRLSDANAVARIVGRIRRMEKGNPGDTRSVGKGTLEMRIDYGPGYRIYYVHRVHKLCSCCAEATNVRRRRISSGLRHWRRHCDGQD